MDVGTLVRFKDTDTRYPNETAKVVKVDTREGRRYLGLLIRAGHHIVWRFEDALA
jgi:hypothetical protein